MTAPSAAAPLRVYARVAGLLYLVLFVTAPFSMLYVPATLVVPDDAATTAQNIMESPGLFRAGMVADTVIFLTEMALPVVFYLLLRSVSTAMALVAAFARLAMAVVLGVNLLLYFAALTLLGGAGYLAAFRPDQLHALALLLLTTHRFGVLVSQIFFGFHLFFLGLLIFKSGYFPKALGILLSVGCFGYLIESYAYFLLPGSEAITYPGLAVAAIAELWLMLWLLFRSGRLPA